MRNLNRVRSVVRGKELTMVFKRCSKNTKEIIEFTTGYSSTFATIREQEIFVGKYLKSDYCLTVRQARKFANKILEFCNRIEAM